jgi:ribose-phosphate pyrophosphokinase
VLSDFVVVGLDGCFLSKSMSIGLDKKFVTFKINKFADGETSVFFDKKGVFEKNIKVIFKFHSRFACICDKNQCSINDQILDLLFLINQLQCCGARIIDLILPYFAYSRHDISDLTKTRGLVDLVGRFYHVAGVDKIFTCDVHNAEIKEFLAVDFLNVSLSEFWIEALKKDFFEEISHDKLALVSPDFGGIDRVKGVAERLGCDVVAIEKKRCGADQSVALGISGKVDGKVAIIIDDIIDTGTTAMNACDLLLERGAAGVVGCFSHAVLSGDSHKRLLKSRFEKIYVTDSLAFESGKLDKKFVMLSIDNFLTQWLKKYCCGGCDSDG